MVERQKMGTTVDFIISLASFMSLCTQCQPMNAT